MALARQRVPKMDIPRREARYNTCLYSLPQPRQELSTKGAARLSYGSKNVKPFGIFARKKVDAPYISQVDNFIAEAGHREARKDLQEGLVWKLKDYFHPLAPAPTMRKYPKLTCTRLSDFRESCLHDGSHLGGVNFPRNASSGHREEMVCRICR